MKKAMMALIFLIMLPLAALAQDNMVKIPLSELSDGQAHFYKIDAGGV